MFMFQRRGRGTTRLWSCKRRRSLEKPTLLLLFSAFPVWHRAEGFSRSPQEAAAMDYMLHLCSVIYSEREMNLVGWRRWDGPAGSDQKTKGQRNWWSSMFMLGPLVQFLWRGKSVIIWSFNAVGYTAAEVTSAYFIKLFLNFIGRVYIFTVLLCWVLPLRIKLVKQLFIAKKELCFFSPLSKLI